MRISVDRCELAVADGGHGTALMLLHGFPMSSAIFDPLRPATEAVARLVTPDLRGFGASEAPVSSYGMDELADDVVALADHLGLERFVLGGHSMGGYVTLRIAARCPDRLAGLVLIDTRAAPDTPEAAETRRAGIAAIHEGRRAELLDGLLPALVGATTRSRRPEVVDQLHGMAERVPDHVLAGCLLGMMERPDSRDLLGELDLPALVVIGAEDTLTSPDEARLIADALPQGRVAVIPSAGHTPTLERPEDAGRLIVSFLREVG